MFFFPGDCPVCGDPPKMDEGHYACKACLDQIAWVGGKCLQVLRNWYACHRVPRAYLFQLQKAGTSISSGGNVCLC